MTIRLPDPDKIEDADLKDYLYDLVREVTQEVERVDSNLDYTESRLKSAYKHMDTGGNICPNSSIILADASASALTLSLPDPLEFQKHTYFIKKTNTNTNDVTINAQTSALIDSSVSFTLTGDAQPSLICYSDGTQYWTFRDDTSIATGEITTSALATGAVTTSALATGAVNTSAIATSAITEDKIDSGAVTLPKIEEISDMRVLGNTTGTSASPSEVTIHDEDDMASDSDTALATQQSTKAYVDSNILSEHISSAIPVSSGVGGSYSHGLGAVPKIIQIVAICQATENGYAVGDRVVLPSGTIGSSLGKGMTVAVTSTTVYYGFGNQLKPLEFHPRGGGLAASLTNTKWKIEIRTYA